MTHALHSVFVSIKSRILSRFTQAALYDYETLRNVIKAFREKYELTGFSFKKIDEFLFQLGNQYRNAEGVLPRCSDFTARP